MAAAPARRPPQPVGPPAGAGVGVGAVAKPARPRARRRTPRNCSTRPLPSQSDRLGDGESLKRSTCSGQKFEIKGSYRKAPRRPTLPQARGPQPGRCLGPHAAGLAMAPVSGNTRKFSRPRFYRQARRRSDPGQDAAGSTSTKKFAKKSWVQLRVRPALRPTWSDLAQDHHLLRPEDQRTLDWARPVWILRAELDQPPEGLSSPPTCSRPLGPDRAAPPS